MSDKKKDSKAAEATEAGSPEAEAVKPEVVQYENPDRENLYAMYEASQNPVEEASDAEPVAETAEASPEEDAPDDDGSDDTDTVPEAAEIEEPEEQEDKASKEKTVPLAALHEEREKRKAIQQKLKELEDAIAKQTKEVDEAKTIEPDFDPEADIDDYETEIRALKKREYELAKKLNELDSFKKTIIEKDKKQIADQAQADLNSRLLKTSKELETDGYPGFDMFTEKIGKELDALIAEDPDNISLDNEDGWKEIYRKKIFPKVKNLFIGQEKAEMLEKKKEAKTKANLASVTNITKKDTSTDEEWSKEDYLKMRLGAL